jgi:hypothetical protein
VQGVNTLHALQGMKQMIDLHAWTHPWPVSERETEQVACPAACVPNGVFKIAFGPTNNATHLAKRSRQNLFFEGTKCSLKEKKMN